MKFWMAFIVLSVAFSTSALANSPEDTVSTYLELIKRGDFDQAGQYSDFANDLGMWLWYSGSSKARSLNGATEALTLLSSKLSYAILDSKVKADEATVYLEVTAVNVPRVMGEVAEMTTARISRNPLNLFQASSIVLEGVKLYEKKQTLPMTTSDPFVKLLKRKNGWVIAKDNKVFREAIIGLAP